ncbi:MAG: Ryanodine receptor Ryr [Planctomycetes bacterium]|nr:Ryanodine receptor Ryr [Planctomycetota bacterium]
MSKRSATIVVAGDVCVDWLEVSVPPTDAADSGHAPPPNWQLYPGTRMVAKPGGALLLAEFVRHATGRNVITHHIENPEEIPCEKIIHSVLELDEFPYSSDEKDAKNTVYRVKQYRGFAGPVKGVPEPLGMKDDDPSAPLVILDDAGNGFRDAQKAWPAAIRRKGKKPIVVLKMSRPLMKGGLWERVTSLHSERLVVVVSADDLRAEGANISRGLSWERTATDFAWQMACNPSLMPLSNCVHLVVRFGIDGAICCTKGKDGAESRLYYDPLLAEGEFHDTCPETMSGLNSAFCAALAKRLTKEGMKGLGEGVRDGIIGSRRLFRQGFGADADQLDYPGAELFGADEGDTRQIADVLVPPPTETGAPDPEFWCILKKDISGLGLEQFAYDIVVRGETAALEGKGVPVGQFGLLKTIDRTEIESYRSIRNLMREYLATAKPKRPLSIAVFGPPGSGKSFGVTQVAEGVARDEIGKLEFNISQFGSPTDLVSALHKVRDVVLEGKVPLVFFDEFDSSFGDTKLGWLKYFLAPMQDGAFKEGETMHPIGKAIFVFAGGTSGTFAEFARERPEGQHAGPFPGDFRDAKGPDFVSRLRGYVNVLGPNPLEEGSNLFMIRRGMLVRMLLEQKAKHLIDGGKRARIDEGVLRALIKLPRYKHGVRSIAAIIDMSMLAGRKSFEQAALPPAKQLELHVDADAFSQLVARDVLLGAAREKIARAIHEKYLRDQKGKKSDDDPVMRPWNQLAEEYKESNRQQADQIPKKLRKIGCGFSPVTGRDPVKIKFTSEEVEVLSEMEHERYVSERRLAGWTLGPRDDKKKTSPHLIPWDDLEDEVREWDRQAVRGIPEFMADAGFEIYRLH